MKPNQNKIQKICFGALFAAIICVCTLISIPLPIGYFNLGDAAVLLSAWILGPLYGVVAAAIGSALSDLVMGYVIYAPATAVIKALMALCAYSISKALLGVIKKPSLFFIPRAISATVAEAVMVVGYFVYEFFALSYGFGAAASVLGNVTQGVCGIVIATTVSVLLQRRTHKNGLI